jgi:hypothetical protein|tara:strand:- start:2049 stop:2483 length:435 start_codon:yes stop_codon:yes gene_type:complete
MLLSRDDILNVDDTRYEEIDMPEWNGSVRIRGLSAADRSRIESEYTESTTGPDGVPKNKVDPRFRAALCSMCIVDDEGKRMFSEADIEALGNKNGANLERIFDRARKLSGIVSANESDGVTAQAKNSESIQNEDSKSDLRAISA